MSGDRRTRKTRSALLGAFAGLVHARPYEDIRVQDILDEADVGRSTFYEHYRGKDDLLLQSMGGLLDVLASAAVEPCDLERLTMVLDHFQERRRAAHEFFAGAQQHDLQGRIAREIAARVARARAAEGSCSRKLPEELVATWAAESILGFVRGWLARPPQCEARVIAQSMHASLRASLDAVSAG